MSSELIGELGQVGLTIGEPVVQQAPEDEDNAPVDEGMSDDSDAASAPGAKRSRGSSNSRPKRFRSAWMMFDIFKDWLRPHQNPELANCIVCSRVIKAGKSELEKHATGKRHLKMLKEQQQQGISLLISSGGDPTADLDAYSLHEEGVHGGEGSGNEGGKQQFIMYRDIDQQYAADTHSAAVDDSYSAGGNLYVPMQGGIPNRNSDTSRDSKLFVTGMAPKWRATAIVNGHVTRLDANDYKGRYVVLFFYSHNFSKVDASEINRLSDRISDFRNVHTEIVACSTDSHLSHLAWVKKSRGEGGVSGVKIPLIADPTHVISKDFGVYIQAKGHCLRAHFIIDRRGILRHMAINDPLIGRGTDEILRIVKALQFSDQIEEPLVADWAPEV